MFAQQKVVSIQETLKGAAFDEIGELFYFANEYYGEYLLDLVDEFTGKARMDENISSMLIPHFLSWAVFSHQLPNAKETILQLYLESPHYKIRRRPRIHRIISQWKHSMPGIYFIEELVGERVLVVTDVFQMKEKVVGIYNEIYQQPKERDLALGYLLPAGDATHSPIIDFFHIPITHKKEVLMQVVDYYCEHVTDDDHAFFVTHYPALLSIVSKVLQS
ncbi:hypothetical protein [Mesobacillus subterraneus]|uniref:Uncharacterized protein n=1 Tax=Mesobacillus subterraneus TaxID=285983 RepID=A0A427TP95_9BACI|nr:hypothetical protein [Mesobacillus subterraneus]RSD26117.1 hypothetical protein EJA10_14925 [Mesobacillus subterraneus]